MRLRLRNTGDVVDEYRFEVVGPVAAWTRVEPPTLRLYPGTTGTVQLTFAPPRTPDAAAGPNPYAVRITPAEHPEATTVPEGNLTITPFTEVRAELVPPTVKGRFRGRPKLAIDNLGNTRLTASVSGNDNGDQLSYDIRPSYVQIEPGRAQFVKATLKPRRVIWFGAKEQRPYTVNVLRSGAEPLPAEGTFVQRGFLPRWLATVFGIFLGLAITFVLLWTAYKPAVKTGATRMPVAAGAALTPSPSLSPNPPAAETGGEENTEAATGGEENTEVATGGGEKDTASGSGGGGRAPAPAKKTAAPVVPATNVLLRNTVTKKCADIPGYEKGKVNGKVYEFTCNGTSQNNQLWNLEVKYPKGGPGGRPLFQIRNAKDGLCMDLPYYGAAPIQSLITEYTCDGTTADNQLWWLDKQHSGAYWIRNFASDNKCLDVAGFSTGGNETNLTLYDCSTSDDQEWLIVHPRQG